MNYSWRKFVIASFRHHLLGNLAVFLGVMVACVAITGAFVVGDSLRHSLAGIVEKKLGWVESAVVSQNMFRASLASSMSGNIQPVLLLQATIQFRDESDSLVSQASGVQIFGVEDSFFKNQAGFRNQGAIINSILGKKLGLSSGKQIVALLPRQTDIPRESFLGRKNDLVDSWRLSVDSILDSAHPMNVFSVSGGVEQPLNIYVKLSELQAKLGMAGKVNVLLADAQVNSKQFEKMLGLEDYGLKLSSPEGRAKKLIAKLDRNQDGVLEKREYQGKIADAVLRDVIQKSGERISSQSLEKYYSENRPYLNLEADRFLIHKEVTQKAFQAGDRAGLVASQIQVYLANTISNGKDEIPYSLVAGVDDFLAERMGLNLKDPSGEYPLALFPWNDSPFQLKDKKIQLSFFAPESVGKPKELNQGFVFSGISSGKGEVLDPDIAPDFPGITDRLTLDSWDPPFPYDNKRIKPRDEKYWKDFKTIPKAFIRLETAQKLWGTRFGDTSSIRFYAKDPASVSSLFEKLESELIGQLSPESRGLVFKNLRQNMIQASQSGTDFSLLFLGFSFFLIASALILVGLLFRLHLERRFSQIGLLLSLGATPRLVRKLLLYELILIALIGALVGGFCSTLYANGLLYLLKTTWPDKTLQSILELHISPKSLVIGGVITVVMAILVVFRSVGKISRGSTLALLRGEVRDIQSSSGAGYLYWLFGGAGLVLVSLVLAMIPKGNNHEIRALMFFGSGGLALIGFMFVYLSFLMRVKKVVIRSGGLIGFGFLALKNLCRNYSRAMLSSGLLASAAFLLIAVEPFRKDPKTEKGLNSGTGGFSLVVKTSVPLLVNQQDQSFSDFLADGLAGSLRGDPQKARNFAAELNGLLPKSKWIPLRYLPGDDVSCSNLFAPEKPRIIGLPPSFMQRGGFVFSAINGKGDNPWNVLQVGTGIIPAFVEKNTAEWMLHTGFGKVFNLINGRGEKTEIRFDGLLQNSLFQSEILLSEENFLKLYPSHEGYSMFLFESNDQDSARLLELLEIALADYGVDIQKAEELLRKYGAVENAYLSMFQALGSIGLVLGTFGVAATLIRSVWERRGEIGLLKALGFNNWNVQSLFLLEYAILLALGLGIGSGAALFSVIPLEQSSWERWWMLLMIQLGMFLFGLMVCVISLWTIKSENILRSMRKE